MKINLRELALFSILGVIMLISKLLMEALPNIHLLGTLIVSITVVYRQKALYPIYTYVFLNGLFAGFNLWWIPYLYLWTILWGMTMLIPKSLPEKIKPFLYIGVSALHGILFGVFYAPAQALFFGLFFEGMIAWIAAGFYFDILQCVGNIVCGILIMPLVKLLTDTKKLITK